MSLLRTFIAVEASGGVRSHAVALIDRLRRIDAQVGWVRPENMHWTLKFLGNVKDSLTSEICRVTSEAVAGFDPFEVVVQGVGAFPNVERPRTIWLGSPQGEEEMAQIAERLDAALLQLGLPREGRRFKAHLTIGRVRGPKNIAALGRRLAELTDYSGGVTAVDELVVFSSHLEKEGPLHQPLAYCPFDGSGPKGE